MTPEEVEEELAALRRGFEELDGVFDLLREVFLALIATHPQPLALAQHLHRAMLEWDAKRLPLSGPPGRLLAELRLAADGLASLEDPTAMAREHQRRTRDEFE
jgi:hypothetical protein